jgi:hypothetical protein
MFQEAENERPWPYTQREGNDGKIVKNGQQRRERRHTQVTAKYLHPAGTTIV